MSVEKLEDRSMLSVTISSFTIQQDASDLTTLPLVQNPYIGPITSNVAPTFDVNAPANSIINIYDDVAGTGVFDPSDPLIVSNALVPSSGPLAVQIPLNASPFPTGDGTRYMLATATDPTDNTVSAAVPSTDLNAPLTKPL